jgi:glucose-6-phosphate 1-epimerase
MEDGGWVSARDNDEADQNRYVCIEPGYVRDFKVIAPGEEFVGQQVITVL